MSTSYFKIAGGTVYDPVHGVNGERRDIWIRDGKIVAAPSDPDVRPDRTLDAAGLVVMVFKPIGSVSSAIAGRQIVFELVGVESGPSRWLCTNTNIAAKYTPNVCH